MTLLLNYRPVLRQPTGIGVYAQAVLPALQQLPHVLVAGGEQGTALQRLRRLAWSQWRLLHLARRHSAIRSTPCRASTSVRGCRPCCASAAGS